MAGVMPGRAASQQGPVLQGGASRPRFRERRRAPGLADRRVRRSLQVSTVVVRRVGRGSRRRPTARGPRQTGLRPESPQRSVLAGTAGESVRQVSFVPIIVLLALKPRSDHKLRPWRSHLQGGRIETISRRDRENPRYYYKRR